MYQLVHCTHGTKKKCNHCKRIISESEERWYWNKDGKFYIPFCCEDCAALWMKPVSRVVATTRKYQGTLDFGPQ